MADVIESGEAEKAVNNVPLGEKWYITHHGI